jgi:hypothetical protein
MSNLDNYTRHPKKMNSDNLESAPINQGRRTFVIYFASLLAAPYGYRSVVNNNSNTSIKFTEHTAHTNDLAGVTVDSIQMVLGGSGLKRIT